MGATIDPGATQQNRACWQGWWPMLDGERLTPSHAVKKGRRYRYYVSAALISRPERTARQVCGSPRRNSTMP